MRKHWEWCAIAQALAERGMLCPGRAGLRFAVGREVLPSLFASMGARVDATDIDAGTADNQWTATNQHATAVDDLFYPALVDQEDFRERVRFYPADMRRVESLPSRAFDFVWSSCALEHLGSLEAGMRFVKTSMSLLRPGGVAVHTTEFNVQSDHDTIEHGRDVLYRKKDLLRLKTELGERGDTMAPFDFDPGDHSFDVEFDAPPYFTAGRPHVKLLLHGFVCTSILLIIHRCNRNASADTEVHSSATGGWS